MTHTILSTWYQHFNFFITVIKNIATARTISQTWQSKLSSQPPHEWKARRLAIVHHQIRLMRFHCGAVGADQVTSCAQATADTLAAKWGGSSDRMWPLINDGTQSGTPLRMFTLFSFTALSETLEQQRPSGSQLKHMENFFINSQYLKFTHT